MVPLPSEPSDRFYLRRRSLQRDLHPRFLRAMAAALWRPFVAAVAQVGSSQDGWTSSRVDGG